MNQREEEVIGVDIIELTIKKTGMRLMKRHRIDSKDKVKHIKTRKHKQSYRHADPRLQRPQVAQRRIGVRNTGDGR